MRSKLLHGFVKCSDGRLYHRALGPIAIQQYEKLKAGNIKRLQGRARSHKHPHPDDGNADVTRYETRTKRVTSASPNASPNAHREERRVLYEPAESTGLVRTMLDLDSERVIYVHDAIMGRGRL